MKKKTYTMPMTEVVHATIESPLCLVSNNDTKTGTGQEGEGENNNPVLGTGGDGDPSQTGRNAKEYDLWDLWD